MSFYGNSYFYTVESFARIVLYNSGLNKVAFPQTDKLTNNILIDALKRESGVKIDSGNHWIGLEPMIEEGSGSNGIKEGFKIWHNAPLTTDASRFFTTLQTDSDPPASAGIIKEEIGFGEYLKAPLVYYDSAGHLMVSAGARYIKMPDNPNEEILDEVAAAMDRMNTIDGENGEPSGGSLKKQLLSRMNTIDGADEEPYGGSLKTQLTVRMNGIDENLAALTTKIDTTVANFDSNIQLIQDLKTMMVGDEKEELPALLSPITEEIVKMSHNISALIADIEVLKNDVASLKSATTTE